MSKRITFPCKEDAALRIACCKKSFGKYKLFVYQTFLYFLHNFVRVIYQNYVRFQTVKIIIIKKD